MPSTLHFEVIDIPSDLFPAHRWKLHFNSPTSVSEITDDNFMLLQSSGKMLLQTDGAMKLQGNG